MVGAATIQTIEPSCSTRLSRSGFGANRFPWKARYPIEAVLLHCKIRSKSGWLSVLLEARKKRSQGMQNSEVLQRVCSLPCLPNTRRRSAC
jgi:hypothetical protein